MVIPENYFSIPGLLKQSRIFFIRDMLSKLANRQYVMMSLLVAPLLALVLSFFTKYSKGWHYQFSENENLFAFLFMCVLTALFLGLIISADEIVKDRKILRRESFLNLSWFSYLNSKLMIMFLISAIQTISFILIGNFILEIKGMTLSYWIILFTTSCFANILGLNISSAFNSVVTIYIIIPLILIPQILFSGVMVKFDRLRSRNQAATEYVPIIGDMMTARWSFEALAVEQFKNNRFERNFFNYNVDIYQNDWYAYFLIKALKTDLWQCKKLKDSARFHNVVKDNFSKLDHYIDRLNMLAGFGAITGSWKSSLSFEKFDSVTSVQTEHYLDSLETRFRKMRKAGIALKDSVENKLGRETLMKLRENYENRKLVEVMLNEMDKDKVIETPDRIIQKYAPAYMRPVTKNGRTHFYAPYKMVGNLSIDTFWFNIIVLWIVNLMLYMALYFNLLQKTVIYFGSLRLIPREK